MFEIAMLAGESGPVCGVANLSLHTAFARFGKRDPKNQRVTSALVAMTIMTGPVTED